MSTLSSPAFRPVIEIGERRVGPDQPAYVIAEAGANHNRDLGIAKALIDAAADAGADAVKFQTYTGTDLYSHKTPRFEYLQDERSPRELLDAISLPREWQAELAEHARSRADRVLLDAFRPRCGRRSRGARCPRDEDRVVRARRPAAYRPRCGGRGPDDPLDRHGDLRRDRGCAGRGPVGGQRPGRAAALRVGLSVASPRS